MKALVPRSRVAPKILCSELSFGPVAHSRPEALGPARWSFIALPRRFSSGSASSSSSSFAASSPPPTGREGVIDDAELFTLEQLQRSITQTVDAAAEEDAGAARRAPVAGRRQGTSTTSSESNYSGSSGSATVDQTRYTSASAHFASQQPLTHPKRCLGCGAAFQSSHPEKAGFVESRLLQEYGASGRKKILKHPRGVPVEDGESGASAFGVEMSRNDNSRFRQITRLLVCRRCWRLQNYKCDEDYAPPAGEKGDVGGKSNRVGGAQRPQVQGRDQRGPRINPFYEQEEEEAVTAGDKGKRQQTTAGEAAPSKAPSDPDADTALAPPRATHTLLVSPHKIVEKILSQIRPNSLVLQIVDILDFEASLCPELYVACKSKGCQVLFVLNKIDLLPSTANLNRVKMWARNMARQVKNVHNADVVLVSSANEQGFDVLEERLKMYLAEVVSAGRKEEAARGGVVGSNKKTTSKVDQHPRKMLGSGRGDKKDASTLHDGGPDDSFCPFSAEEDGTCAQHPSHRPQDLQPKRFIYVTGRVNSGKTTFVQRWLRFIGYKHLPTINWKRAAGGITRAPIPGTTSHFLEFPLPKNFRLVDTPGVPSTHQITGSCPPRTKNGGDHDHQKMTKGLFPTSRDLYDVAISSKLQPITYALKPGRTLLVGANLARFDLLEPSTFAFVTCFFSKNVTLHVCNTGKVDDALKRKAGRFFYPPHEVVETVVEHEGCTRSSRELPFALAKHRVEVFGSNHRSWDDIHVAGLGWIAVSGFGSKVFEVSVPKGVKIFRRPSILPFELCGKTSPPGSGHSGSGGRKKRSGGGVAKFSHRNRARGSSIARKKKKMVALLRDRDRKYELREALEAVEEKRKRSSASSAENDEEVIFEVTV